MFMFESQKCFSDKPKMDGVVIMNGLRQIPDATNAKNPAGFPRLSNPWIPCVETYYNII